MAFSGDPLGKIKPRNLEGTGLITVAAADAFVLIYDHRTFGKFSYGCYRADAGTGRPLAVLAGPVLIVALGAILGVGAEGDHNPAVGTEIRIPVGNQFIPVHFSFIPALASRHAPLAAYTSEGIGLFGVSP